MQLLLSLLKQKSSAVRVFVVMTHTQAFSGCAVDKTYFSVHSYRQKLFDNYFNENIVFHIQWEKDNNDFTIIFVMFQRNMQSIRTGHSKFKKGANITMGCEYKLLGRDRFYGISIFKDNEEFFGYFNDRNCKFLMSMVRQIGNLFQKLIFLFEFFKNFNFISFDSDISFDAL